MASTPTASLPVLGSRDRRCRGWSLDNRLRRWWAPARDEADLLSVRAGQSVADLGAGVGFLTREFLERVGPSGRVLLVDPDARNLSVARARWGGDPRVQTVVASAAAVPFIADRSVDRVALSLVLCCMVDKAGAMDEAWRILRPDGLVLVSYPERRRWTSVPTRSLRVTPELWQRLLVRHSWEVISTERRRFIRRHLLRKPLNVE
jgi:ubiquinone/menaquinone biosynthesis C-methylase UbiE